MIYAIPENPRNTMTGSIEKKKDGRRHRGRNNAAFIMISIKVKNGYLAVNIKLLLSRYCVFVWNRARNAKM